MMFNRNNNLNNFNIQIKENQKNKEKLILKTIQGNENEKKFDK